MRRWPGVGLLNCCSRSVLICAPVQVLTVSVFANGCTSNSWPYGDLAGRDVCADAARVHERDLRAAEVARLRRSELGIGDDVAERGLARQALRRARDRGVRRSDDPTRDRPGDRVVVVDQARHRRILGNVTRDDHVACRLCDDVVRLRVDRQVDVSDQATEGRRARHELAVEVRADVWLVGVRADDDVDLGIHPVDDVDDVAAEALAGVVEPGGPALEAALVEQDDDRLDAELLQARHEHVHRVRLVEEVEPLHAGRRDDLRRSLERLADEGDLGGALLAVVPVPVGLDLEDLVGREQRVAPVRVVEDVGGEEVEHGAEERRAVLAAVDRVAAAESACAATRLALRRTRGCRHRSRRDRAKFIASIVGSSWKSPERSGLAPIRSPALTMSVFCGLSASSCWICVERYSTPPARTVVTGLLLIRIVPLVPVGGCRLPWKSLNASTWTLTSCAFAGLAAWVAEASARAASMRAGAAQRAVGMPACVLLGCGR